MLGLKYFLIITLSIYNKKEIRKEIGMNEQN
jgi:hypothetical protein